MRRFPLKTAGCRLAMPAAIRHIDTVLPSCVQKSATSRFQHQHVFVKKCYPFSGTPAMTPRSPMPHAEGEKISLREHAQWLLRAGKTARDFRTWSRLLNSKDNPPSPTGPSSRWLHQLFGFDHEFVCDVCGASWKECDDVTKHWRNGDRDSFHIESPLRQSIISNASSPSTRPSTTLFPVAKVHWTLMKLLRSNLKKVPPHNNGNKKSSSNSLTQHSPHVGSLAEVAKGLRRSLPLRREELQGQLDAGRQFPAVHLSTDTLMLCSRMAAFSAATYGPAYLEGFYSSIRCNSSLHLPGFRSFISPPEEIHRKAAKVLLGIDDHRVVDIVRCSAMGDETTYAASYSIFVDHRFKNIIVAFRGTTSLGDMVTVVTSNPMLLSDIRRGSEATSSIQAGGEEAKRVQNTNTSEPDESMLSWYVPGGFGESIKHALRTLEEPLAQLEKSLCDYETYFTGHSLGAIQANLYHLATSSAPDGSNRQRARKVVGFAPAPCVSLGIAEYQQQNSLPTSATQLINPSEEARNVLNFAYGHDIVPRLQVSSLREKLRRYALSAESNTSGNGDYYLPGTTLWIDPASSASSDKTPHDTSSGVGNKAPGGGVSTHHPLRQVLVLPRQQQQTDDDASIIKQWNVLPSCKATLEHHFLQRIQRYLCTRIAFQSKQ